MFSLYFNSYNLCVKSTTLKVLKIIAFANRGSEHKKFAQQTIKIFFFFILNTNETVFRKLTNSSKQVFEKRTIM